MNDWSFTKLLYSLQRYSLYGQFYRMVAGAFIILLSCKEKVSSNEPSELADDFFHYYTYEAKEIGWEIEIPGYLKLISSEEADTLHKKGKTSLENDSKTEVAIKSVKNLLGFHLNESNLFRSHLGPSGMATKGAWKKMNCSNKLELYTTYRNLGFLVDSSKTTVVDVNELEFASYDLTLYYDTAHKKVQNQLFYISWIDQRSFTATITTTKEADKALLIAIWQGSLFSKK